MPLFVFFFSSRRRHTRFDCDWSSDVCSSDLLRVVPIQVPQLRDRPEDIPLLPEYFLSTHWIRHRNKGAPHPKLSDAARRTSRGHSWRRRARERQHAIEPVAELVAPGTESRPEDL